MINLDEYACDVFGDSVGERLEGPGVPLTSLQKVYWKNGVDRTP